MKMPETAEEVQKKPEGGQGGEGEEKLLTVASSPHLLSGEDVPRLMYGVALALLPALVAAVFLFGWGVLRLVAAVTVASLIAEAAFQRARSRTVTISDGSALVTGLLLALTLPPGLPIWMGVVGGVFAIVFGKQIYGGLGSNPFNPALIGRVFLMVAFPVAMTTWTAPVDAVSTATPLTWLKMEGVKVGYLELFWGKVGGSLGETSVPALLLGAAWLLYRGYIDWRIPAGYLGTVALLALALGRDPLFHLLAGGLLLGAFFMATDPVTSPVTPAGRWIFGAGCGLITMIIRLFGGYPEGVAYSILIMNGFTPLLDRFLHPIRYGEVKRA